MLRRAALLYAVTILNLMSAGCGVRGERLAQPPILEGTEWVLTSLRGRSLAKGSEITLSFYPGNYLEGSAGCNSYGGNYLVEGQGFSIPQLHRTEFDCGDEDGGLRQEVAYLEALQNAALHGMLDGHLVLRDAHGVMLMTFSAQQPPPVDADLEGSEWTLESLSADATLPGSRITLSLGRDGFGGFTDCNRYGGEYEAADEGAFVIATLWYTEAECRTSALQVQEQAYLRALSDAATYRLIGERLEIGDATGQVRLAFDGQHGSQPASQ